MGLSLTYQLQEAPSKRNTYAWHEIHNKNMKALGVLESKWDPIRQKLVRRLLGKQDKVLRSYFAQ